jgi:hypothetical protein
MAKKTFLQEVNVTKANYETGEILTESRTEVGMFEKEPPFVKMYIEDIGKLNNLPNYVSNILYELLSNMGYNNVVPMYMPIKMMICEKIGISVNSLNKAIDELYKKGILLRKARGFYMMDPHIFGRGSWKDVKDIRMTITYDEKTNKRIIKSEISQTQLSLFGSESVSNSIPERKSSAEVQL